MSEDCREAARIVRVWLDAMGQRLSHAFMNAYFKHSPSWANLCCLPEWGCWLKANYTLQIWPLVKTLLIRHGLDSGLGACLWASAPDSHACKSANQRGARSRRPLWALCLCHWKITKFIFNISFSSLTRDYLGCQRLTKSEHYLLVYLLANFSVGSLEFLLHYWDNCASCQTSV